MKRWLMRVGLLGTSTLVTLLLLEVVWRVFFPQPLYAIQFAPWGYWHIPKICLTHGAEPSYEGKILRGTEFVTSICYNSFGMREREIPLAKESGTKRVLILGDSYGEGMEVEFDQTVGQMLERILNREIAEVRRSRRSLPSPVAAETPGPVVGRPDWAATAPIFSALDQAVRSDAARLLVVNVHYEGEDARVRGAFFARQGIPWLDLAPADRPEYHYVYDSHWNPLGHQRAAEAIAGRIADDGLLSGEGVRKIEVLNAAMSAFSTCKELHVYQAIGRRFSPDLVIAIQTASDNRNLADLDMCAAGPNGVLEVHPRTYTSMQIFVRNFRGYIKSHSHFLTWVIDRTVALPFMSDLRQEQVPVRDPDRGSP